MINFVPPQNPYRHPYGEIFAGDHADHVREMQYKEWEDHNLFATSYISPVGWNALLSIRHFDKTAVGQWRDLTSYECPYTHRTYYGMIPIGILTKDPLQYCPSPDVWYAKMACDREWNFPNGFLTSSDLTELNEIQRCVIGPGYTHGTMINDGNSSLHPVVVDLSNGDAVLFITHVWHNK